MLLIAVLPSLEFKRLMGKHQLNCHIIIGKLHFLYCKSERKYSRNTFLTIKVAKPFENRVYFPDSFGFLLHGQRAVSPNYYQ